MGTYRSEAEQYVGDQDLSFLEETTAPRLSNEVAVLADKLTMLKERMDGAEQLFNQAKRDYDEFRSVTLPNSFRLAGITSLQTTSGSIVRVVTKYHCSPNKNDADRAVMAAWLREQGGEHLIKEEARVVGSDIAVLKAAKIPHEVKSEVNTNSLKAWLKSKVGADGSVATLELDAIPKVIHFVGLDECEVMVGGKG